MVLRGKVGGGHQMCYAISEKWGVQNDEKFRLVVRVKIVRSLRQPYWIDLT